MWSSSVVFLGKQCPTPHLHIPSFPIVSPKYTDSSSYAIPSTSTFESFTAFAVMAAVSTWSRLGYNADTSAPMKTNFSSCNSGALLSSQLLLTFSAFFFLSSSRRLFNFNHDVPARKLFFILCVKFLLVLAFFV